MRLCMIYHDILDAPLYDISWHITFVDAPLYDIWWHIRSITMYGDSSPVPVPADYGVVWYILVTCYDAS